MLKIPQSDPDVLVITMSKHPSQVGTERLFPILDEPKKGVTSHVDADVEPEGQLLGGCLCLETNGENGES